MAENNYRDAIFTPSATAQIGLRHTKRAMDSRDRALSFHIGGEPSAYFADVMPGEIVAVQAQTHNYKSGFLDSWEADMARQLREQGRVDEIIVHVDLETVIEHQAAREMAKIIRIPTSDIARGNIPDIDVVRATVTTMSGTPIYRIGATLGRGGIRFENLYLTNIMRAIQYIKSDNDDPDKRLHDTPRKIAAVFIDYLQSLPFDPEIRRKGFEDARRLQVRSDVYRIRSGSALFDAPFFVALQAKQDLGGAPSRDFYIPGIYDGKESSDIAERFDRVISLWMPKITHRVGEIIEYKDISFVVQENMLMVKVAKQRGGLPSGQTFPCLIDFATNTISYRPSLVQRR